ncbi:hypothetical protein ACWGOQ_0016210 [Aquimarina sp. M1]
MATLISMKSNNLIILILTNIFIVIHINAQNKKFNPVKKPQDSSEISNQFTPKAPSITPLKNTKQDYTIYHKQVIEAETLIASEQYKDALQIYEKLFNHYQFIFIREYQVASQLAFYLDNKLKGFEYLKRGILTGWKMKSIKKNTYLKSFQKENDFKLIEKNYDSLRNKYESTLHQYIRNRVKKMYSKDQWKAFKALFRFNSKAHKRYAEKKFAPHSEKQMAELSDIISAYGYPGERFIGNNYWTSTIISHHNSISTSYNKKDVLYIHLKPELENALKNGQISPYEFATIDDWYLTVKYDRSKPTYGVLDAPSKSTLTKTNMLRKTIHVRPYELRDPLVRVQKQTGMNLYLSDRWY